MTKFRTNKNGKRHPITPRKSNRADYKAPNVHEYKGYKILLRPRHGGGYFAQVPKISSQYLGEGKTKSEAINDAKDSIDKIKPKFDWEDVPMKQWGSNPNTPLKMHRKQGNKHVYVYGREYSSGDVLEVVEGTMDKNGFHKTNSYEMKDTFENHQKIMKKYR